MSDDRNSSGLASALAQLGAAVGQEPGNGDQLEIFEPDMPTLTGAKPRSGPKGGRPPGATNKTQKEWVAYLMQRYRSPMVTLLELTTMTPKDLAEQLGLYVWSEGELVIDPRTSKPVLATGEAFKRQIEAAVALLPYVHQKMPLEIQQTGDKRGLLVIGDLNVTLNASGDEGLNLADDDKTIDVTPREGEVG